MKLITMIAMLFSIQTFANLHQAPPHLDLDRGTKGVFVDFKTALTTISYNLNTRTATALTKITFDQKEMGRAIFDLISNPISVKLNGEEVSTTTTSMKGESTVRIIDTISQIGTHTLEVKNEITRNLSWNGSYVKSAFWMSDLSDRQYLEQYIPTNLEYDQYKINFQVTILGEADDHVLYTNGDVQDLGQNTWKVSYPEVYTASSMFFHLTKKGLIPERKVSYKSIDGREIPVTIYTNNNIDSYERTTLSTLAELEKDYGPWPHAQVLIYGAGSGGMEHCGATITSHYALGHELTHSYFARGIMPAHGNSGWVDEAVASWRDGGYKGYSAWNLSRTNMAGHSTYQRTTDRDAYTKGMRFIGFLHKKFEEKESFKVFLKSFFDEKKFVPFKTHEFQNAVEKFYNVSLDEEFNTYVYGKNGVDETKEIKQENPYHKRYTGKELLELL